MEKYNNQILTVVSTKQNTQNIYPSCHYLHTPGVFSPPTKAANSNKAGLIPALHVLRLPALR